MAIVGVTFLFEIPGLKEGFRISPLNLLKNNRFVFLTTWSLLVMAVVGMQVLSNVRLRWRAWTLIPFGILIGLVLWSIYNRLSMPEAIQIGLPEIWGDAEVVQAWFRRAYLGGALVCGMGVLFWLAIYSGKLQGWVALIVVGCVCLGELLALDHGVNPQVLPSLYYPPLKPLEELNRAPPGRICGVLCMPPSLNQRYRLSDIRGYDGVDPTYLVELLELCERKTPKRLLIKPRHAVTQYFYPVDSPLLDMLNMRYRVFQGEPPPRASALFKGDGYWVAENKKYLPRAFVPTRVECLSGDAEVLANLAKPHFNPREVAYVAQPLSLEDGVIQGRVEVIHQGDGNPNLVQLRVAMETPGLIVVGDLWFPGWNA